MITDHQLQVKEFMIAMKQQTPETPTMFNSTTAYLRRDLIQEEANELSKAIDHMSNYSSYEEFLVCLADAIADILYVTYGAAIAAGIDIHPIFNIVHRSNMAKLGGPIREDGKQMRPEGWTPPTDDILTEVQSQIYG